MHRLELAEPEMLELELELEQRALAKRPEALAQARGIPHPTVQQRKSAPQTTLKKKLQ